MEIHNVRVHTPKAIMTAVAGFGLKRQKFRAELGRICKWIVG